ncbi:MAG: UDP-N-acetylmuramate--L-alanine ligase [Nitrospirae bacterium]|nr:UDP-N-acetylmuramate--L-alanine ligase [Nitrospirota bacterium]
MYKRFERIHFVGIGGAGMSGIAEVLKNLGYEVTGSDLKESETTRRLAGIGIPISIGHNAQNVKDAHVVVISSAVSQYNPEVAAARERSLPVIPRAEMLAELARLKYGVLIAGAHGKTTVTSLVAGVLASGGLDPTVVVGGKLMGMGSNAKLGRGDFLVAEADESDGSFLKLDPTIGVVTNIDREHMDFYKNIDELKNAFLAFMNKVPFYGLNILCGDNEHVRSLLPLVQRRFITYGMGEGLDLTARNINSKGLRTRFEAVLNGRAIGEFDVPLIGRHNVANCLAAIAVANELDIEISKAREALSEFGGVKRRSEQKGEVSGIKVMDDYGHHPAEIMATLKAIREAMLGEKGAGRLIVLYQPHRYSRTHDLLRDFFTAFGDADKVMLMNIYAAGESPIEGVNSAVLCKEMKNAGTDAEHIEKREEIVSRLRRELRAGDILLTLGAGDVWKLGEEFLKACGEA